MGTRSLPATYRKTYVSVAPLPAALLEAILSSLLFSGLLLLYIADFAQRKPV